MPPPVEPKSLAFRSSISLTRPSDTNSYAAGDVIGTATGSTAAFKLLNVGPSDGGDVFITTAQFQINVSSIPSGMTGFRLYLYSSAPPSAYGDNAAWDLPSGDRASFLGYVDLGSPVDLGSTLYVETSQINRQITAPVGGALFAYLVTLGAFTPTSGAVKVVTLATVGA